MISMAVASFFLPFLPLIAVIGWLAYAEPISAAVLFGAVVIFAANFTAMRAEALARRRARVSSAYSARPVQRRRASPAA